MFNNYEELMQAVEERRDDELLLEIDLGAKYSQEYEDAKTKLKQAEAMQAIAGEQQFLSDNVANLREKAEALRPEAQAVYVRYRRLGLGDWAMLRKSNVSDAIEQYEKVLPQTFIGVFSSPEASEPLTTDASSVSSKNPKGILPGGAVHGVVQAFMAWQNSGGEVSIRPTKSDQD